MNIQKKTVILIFLFFWGLSLPIKSEIRIANDPTIISVGARPLGLGKAFSAIADDPSAIFLNPAGLGTINNWQISSMSSKYLNEFDYVQLSSVFPTEIGIFGIGYGGMGYSFRAASPEVIVIGGEEKYFPSPTSQISASWNNSALVISYGTKSHGNFFFGGNLKLYSQNLSGSNFSSINANGCDLDFGTLYQPIKELKLAGVVQNLLPTTLGGGIFWSNGVQESLPVLARLGVSYHLAGKNGKFSSDQEVLTSLDYEFSPTRNKSSLRLGLEWSPFEFLTLRLGSENGDFTTGLGFIYDQFRFDYAYHTYFGQAWASTNYFSLSYGVGEIPLEPQKELKKEYFNLVSPSSEETIFYQEKMTFRGNIFDLEVNKIIGGGIEAFISKDNQFYIECPLKLGLNIITIEAFDKRGNLLKTITWRGLRLVTFKDLLPGYRENFSIGILATLNIISGYPDGTFRPKAKITRAEMCKLLMKAQEVFMEGKKDKELRGKEKKVNVKFKDVPAKHWAISYIAKAVNQKIVKGYPEGFPGARFKPNRKISRVEGVTMIARFDQVKTEFTRVLESPYSDLPGRHWAALEITAAKEAGMLKYFDDKKFKPKRSLTRAEVAEILLRTKKVKQILLDHDISLP